MDGTHWAEQATRTMHPHAEAVGVGLAPPAWFPDELSRMTEMYAQNG